METRYYSQVKRLQSKY